MAFAFLCLASAIGAVSTGKAARGFYDDKGHRYTPSHTVKNAKRYRYYVAHRAAHLQDARPVRIPAHELEMLVV